APTKLAEYASDGHRAALDAAAAIEGPAEQRLADLLLASLFGNRMDLSFAASRERGVAADAADHLVDDRAAALAELGRGAGPVHFITDNAGTELSLVLGRAGRRVREAGAAVVLRGKVLPAFVSDAIERDVRWFIEGESASAAGLWSACGAPARACRDE